MGDRMMDERRAKQLDKVTIAKARLMDDQARLVVEIISAVADSDKVDGLEAMTNDDCFELVKMAQRVGRNRDTLRELNKTIRALTPE